MGLYFQLRHYLCNFVSLGNCLKNQYSLIFWLLVPEMHDSKLPDEQMMMINTNFQHSNFFKGGPKEFLLNLSFPLNEHSSTLMCTICC